MGIRQRFRDWRHERYIGRLRRSFICADVCRDRVMQRMYWRLMIDAINARSPSQVRRMESRMDFNVRRTVKRRIMDAFLRGRIPSHFVIAVFRLLRLRSL